MIHLSMNLKHVTVPRVTGAGSFLCMFKKNRSYKCTYKLYILNLSARAPSNSAVQGYNENFQGNHDFVYIANNMRCTCASITH